jgi:hypothetical protein
VDRPSQDSGPPSDAGESPLSFPIEAPKLAGVEPGTGAPLGLPAEARPLGDPLAFPAEASAGPPSVPPAPPFPAEFPRPAEMTPLPFPVAELPGSAAPAPAPAAAAPPPDPAAGPGPAPFPAPALPASASASAELLRFVPPALASVAALMVVGGCFLPLFRIQQHLTVGQRFFDAQLTVTKTAWGTLIDIPGQEAADRPGAPLGIPLVIVAAFLAVAAATAFARPGRRLARRLVSASAVFTAGVVTTVGMSRFEWSALLGAEDLEVGTALGMWLLISATVLAAAAAAVAYLPAWQRAGEDWADPALAYTDTPTPPSGVAITVLPPDPEDDRQRP